MQTTTAVTTLPNARSSGPGSDQDGTDGNSICDPLRTYPACDRCFSRKIKCDKRAPCQNCIRSRLHCLHTRSVIPGRRRRKSKAQSKTHLTSPDQNIPPDLTSPSSSRFQEAEASEKEARTTPVSRPNVQNDQITGASPLDALESPKPSNIFSAANFEAQKTLHEILCTSLHLSEDSWNAIRSALAIVNNILPVSTAEGTTTSALVQADTDGLTNDNYRCLASAELLQEIFQREENSAVLFRYCPMFTREMFVEMTMDLLGDGPGNKDPRKIVCVHSILGSYILERSFQTGSSTGLQTCLKQRGKDYYRVVDFGIRGLQLLSAPSLLSINALLVGTVRLLELGEHSAGSNLIGAACHMCRALGLNSRLYNTTPEDDQVRWIFQFCYSVDQGMAMLLGRSPSFHDSEIDERIFLRRAYELGGDLQMDFNYFMVDVARLQSGISSELRSPRSQTCTPATRHKALLVLKQQSDSLYKTLSQLKATATASKRIDYDSQVILAEFSLHSIICIMYRSEPIPPGGAFSNENCLRAARNALSLIPTISTTVAKWHGPISGAYWSVLNYPFTAFFVLFCNAMLTSSTGDLPLMTTMLSYLKEVQESNPVAKRLFHLFNTFCELASTIVTASSAQLASYQQHTHQLGASEVPEEWTQEQMDIWLELINFDTTTQIYLDGGF
ncbi:uncharacterized protein K460DRAFT_418702 [Cucurbitaria berberidis CBS 394.84]|uniref:Zn(2)-C6 fungal-type domain-containing protein n=1 Tax=Cucurbitaria berberidis CBS 394.84 TaxID=1168544 RepID=A0A9P4L723_9PLEO|nr:uncharacterized protein K460DRAFT_418702 [Cucurbitaria berberidis CBS 394.84]KAF1843683.1 hypothetical protein K460DRAFT_418702 [Cucurbitaria berberidis CBS 394.84]